MDLIVRSLGLQAYEPCLAAMKAFTASRDETTTDEIWLLEHHPVFTQGRAGKAEYILDLADIPLVQIDRGGQVTYHGPGQLTAYLLLDIKRKKLGVRELVTVIEESIVASLAHWGIESSARPDAPGVYVEGEKIAALGLRISRGRSYHGLSFNVSMDKEPWQRINPCGLGVPVTQIADLVSDCPDVETVARELTENLTGKLGYNAALYTHELPSGIN